MKVQLHGFGKLPLYGDYVSYECTGRTAVSMRQWIEKAFFGEAGKQILDRLGEEGLRLVNLSRNGKEITVLALKRSTDKGGMRTFPFALFFVLPTKQLFKERPWLCRSGSARLFEELETLHRTIAGKESLSEVYGVLRQWGRNGGELVFPPVDSDSLSTGAGVFVRLMEEEHGTGSMSRLLWGLRHLATIDEKTLHQSAIRLPLVSGPEPGRQLRFWCALLHDAAMGSGRPLAGEPQALVYPGRIDGSVRTGLILFRELCEEDLQSLGPGSPTTVIDLAGEENPFSLDGYFSFNERVESAASDSCLEMSDFLHMAFQP